MNTLYSLLLGIKILPKTCFCKMYRAVLEPGLCERLIWEVIPRSVRRLRDKGGKDASEGCAGGGLGSWAAGSFPLDPQCHQSLQTIAVQEPFQTLLGFILNSWVLQ